jgi:hypothetical protein
MDRVLQVYRRGFLFAIILFAELLIIRFRPFWQFQPKQTLRHFGVLNATPAQGGACLLESFFRHNIFRYMIKRGGHEVFFVAVLIFAV